MVEVVNIMNILVDYINTIEFISPKANSDYVSKDKKAISIVPSGNIDETKDILGNKTVEMQFTVLIKQEKAKYEDYNFNINLLLKLGEYLEKQEDFSLGEKFYSEEFEAVSNPLLQSRDNSGTEVYNAVYKLRYERRI